MISIAEAKSKLEFWKEQALKCEEKARQNGNAISRSESWYLEYYRNPYLTLAGPDYLAQRFIDNFHNNVRLTGVGQMAPRDDFAEDEGLFGSLFTHLLAEYRSRGGTPGSVVGEANLQLDKYFRNDTPTGVSLFRGLPETLDIVSPSGVSSSAC